MLVNVIPMHVPATERPPSRTVVRHGSPAGLGAGAGVGPVRGLGAADRLVVECAVKPEPQLLSATDATTAHTEARQALIDVGFIARSLYILDARSRASRLLQQPGPVRRPRSRLAAAAVGSQDRAAAVRPWRARDEAQDAAARQPPRLPMRNLRIALGPASRTIPDTRSRRVARMPSSHAGSPPPLSSL